MEGESVYEEEGVQWVVRGSNSRKRKGRKGKLDGRDPQASIKLREENVKSYLVPLENGICFRAVALTGPEDRRPY